jgi:hypothetical protein
MVGSLNIGYTPTQKLNLGVSYSNFQTYTNIRSQFIDVNQLTPYDNLDTLNFTQISQNATLTAMYMFGKNENKRQSLNCNLTFQDAADKQGEVNQNSGTQFYNLNTAYALNIVPKNMMSRHLSMLPSIREQETVRIRLGLHWQLVNLFLKRNYEQLCLLLITALTQILRESIQ